MFLVPLHVRDTLGGWVASLRASFAILLPGAEGPQPLYGTGNATMVRSAVKFEPDAQGTYRRASANELHETGKVRIDSLISNTDDFSSGNWSFGGSVTHSYANGLNRLQLTGASPSSGLALQHNRGLPKGNVVGLRIVGTLNVRKNGGTVDSIALGVQEYQGGVWKANRFNTIPITGTLTEVGFDQTITHVDTDTITFFIGSGAAGDVDIEVSEPTFVVDPAYGYPWPHISQPTADRTPKYYDFITDRRLVDHFVVDTTYSALLHDSVPIDGTARYASYLSNPMGGPQFIANLGDMAIPRQVDMSERENWVTTPENIVTGAQWIATRVTVTANARVAPDGSGTMDRVDEDSSAFGHFVRWDDKVNPNSAMPPSINAWASVFIRFEERKHCRFFVTTLAGGNGKWVHFDAEAKEFYSANLSLGNWFEELEPGLFRLAFKFATDTGTSRPTEGVYLLDSRTTAVDYQGVPGMGISVWGWQCKPAAGQYVDVPPPYVPHSDRDHVAGGNGYAYRCIQGGLTSTVRPVLPMYGKGPEEVENKDFLIDDFSEFIPYRAALSWWNNDGMRIENTEAAIGYAWKQVTLHGKAGDQYRIRTKLHYSGPGANHMAIYFSNAVTPTTHTAFLGSTTPKSDPEFIYEVTADGPVNFALAVSGTGLGAYTPAEYWYIERVEVPLHEADRTHQDAYVPQARGTFATIDTADVTDDGSKVTITLNGTTGNAGRTEQLVFPIGTTLRFRATLTSSSGTSNTMWVDSTTVDAVVGQEVVIDYTTTASTTTFGFKLAGVATNAADWEGIHIEEVLSAESSLPVAVSGNSRWALWEYHTFAGGSIEGEHTQYLRYSRDMSQTPYWEFDGGNIAVRDAVGVDGVPNAACTLTDSSNTLRERQYQRVGISGPTISYVVMWFDRWKEEDDVFPCLASGGDAVHYNYSLCNGYMRVPDTGQGASKGVGCKRVHPDWWLRWYIHDGHTGEVRPSWYPARGLSLASLNGDVAIQGSMVVDFATLLVGEAPSSPIESGASNTVRSRDELQYDVANWPNAAGMLVADVIPADPRGSHAIGLIVGLNSATASRPLYLDSNDAAATFTTSESGAFVKDGVARGQGNHRVAVRWGSATKGIVSAREDGTNGTYAQTGYTGWGATSFRIGYEGSAQNQPFSYIRNLLVWDTDGGQAQAERLREFDK